MKTSNQLRIEEGRTKLTVNHNNKSLTFLHPSHEKRLEFKGYGKKA